ncbi:MAG: topoisomerase DNA-binding C4 zinc finger domain-containing protein [Nitrospinae bacterium]|nr:topoisomerase DNA-binding C4 zinc finger domain-containing protein [Nitrospinota bacterium]
MAKGSRAAAASSQTELRLVNVARASLDELLLDYEDFLRQRGLPQWEKDDPQAREVRRVGKTHPDEQAIAGAYSKWLGHADPSVVANAVICLIHQANYLLDRQIGGLERQFINEGGYSERLATARIEERQRRHEAGRPDNTDKQVLACPRCGKVMALRTTRKGARAGSRFWGCSAYPECRGARPLDGPGRSD